MTSHPGRITRIGMTLLCAAACMALLQLPVPAYGQSPTTIDRGEIAAATHKSVTIDWTMPPGLGADVEVAVFYGDKEGGTREEDWPRSANLVRKDNKKRQFQVTLEDLEPNTTYAYRVRVSGPDGAVWSKLATFQTEPWTLPGYLLLLIVIVLLTVPFAIGNRLGRRFRMPDHGWKIGLILCTLACALTVIGFRQKPNLGIDLSGGTILVYEIDWEQSPPDAGRDDLMDRMIAAVSERINPGGQKEMTVRTHGSDQIEVIIPEVDAEETKRVEKVISRVGALQFRILANNRDHENLIRRALREDTMRLTRPGDEEGKEKLEAWWVPVETGHEENFEGYLDVPESEREIAIRETLRHGERVLEVLVVKDDFDVTDVYLANAQRGSGERGEPLVEFSFNSAGATLFGRLTSTNLPDEEQGFYRRLGIILDERLYSAPIIKSAIYKRGVIEMGTPRTEKQRQLQQEEVDDLVRVLNAGGLPVPLSKEPLSRLVSGPTLGRDTIMKGCWAIGASAVLVLVFMLFYYRFAGVIACGALIANLILILAIMMFVRAAFTLPGLAGLVLTVGMAVDANVLIFERIREELARGAALRMAIRNGFSRATTTIVDANLTTLITGVILFVVGTDVIKGFAITLILGVLMSMYTAIFCSRVVFDVGERRRWITKLSMMRILGATNIDFLGKRYVAGACSCVVIVAGLLGVAYRGAGLLDIDFTGGEAVVAVFDEPQDIADIRQVLGDLPDLVVTGIKLEGEPDRTWYRISTSQSEVKRDQLADWAVETLRQQLGQVFATGADSQQRTEAVEAFRGQVVQALQAEPDSDQQDSSIEVLHKQLAKLFADAPQSPRRESALGTVRRQVDRIVRVNTPIEFVEEYIHQRFPGKLASSAMGVEKFAASVPAGDEPPETTPQGADETPPTDQARRSFPRGGLPHVAGLASILLAQTEPPGGPEEAPAADPAESQQPSSEPAPDEGPDEGLDEVPTAVTDEPPLDSPAPAETPAPTAEQPSADSPEGPSAPAEAPVDVAEAAPPGADAPAKTTKVMLAFARELSYDTLLEVFANEFGSAEELPSLTLTPVIESLDPANPLKPDSGFKVGDSTKCTKWNVEIGIPPDEAQARFDSIAATVADTPYFPSSDSIGSQVAKGTRLRAINALVASLFCIVAYVWIRFQRVVFGLAAVVALVHDVLITLGALALSAFLAPYLGLLLIDPFKIGLPVLAAFLTIIGYSLNDTIVVFDRIREVRGKAPKLTAEMVNASINQTLARTLLTSLTTLIVVFILFVFGGEVIHAFAFSLVVGVVVGTYSSVFVASPALLWMTRTAETK